MVITFTSTCNAGRNTRHITKPYLYKYDPIKPHFYIVKLGFTGVYVVFSYFCSKYRLRVLSRNMKKNQSLLSKSFQFLEVKFSMYLTRLVYVLNENCIWLRSKLRNIDCIPCLSWFCLYIIERNMGCSLHAHYLYHYLGYFSRRQSGFSYFSQRIGFVNQFVFCMFYNI